MDIEAILAEAMDLGEQERFEEMAQVLAAALRDEPDEPYLLGWLGVAERELGNEGAAYEYFKRCVAAEPLDPQLLAMAGAGLAAFDDPEAEATLRAAALTGPDLVITRLQYGAYLAREGMFVEALEQLSAAASIDPDDPVVQGELGICHALKGDHAAAADAMEQALARAADDSWTRLLLGLVQAELGRAEPAAESLLQAAEERPFDAEAQLARGAGRCRGGLGRRGAGRTGPGRVRRGGRRRGAPRRGGRPRGHRRRCRPGAPAGDHGAVGPPRPPHPAALTRMAASSARWAGVPARSSSPSPSCGCCPSPW
jgi:tetratricopeptide (TPR) repeat protein